MADHNQMKVEDLNSSNKIPGSTLFKIDDESKLNNFVETEGKLGKGIFGEVFYGKIKSSSQPVVIKYNQRNFINDAEYAVLKSLQAKEYSNFPTVYMKGIAKDKPFIVCQRFGQSLQ